MADDYLSRLERLMALRAQGTIDQGEFDQMKARILVETRAGIWAQDPAGSRDYPPARDRTLLAHQVGDEIGPLDERFRLVERIGGGGMGEVWRALDLEESRRAGEERWKALKLLPQELARHPKHLELLAREADLAKKLSHPHIINVYGLRRGRDDIPYLLMDCLAGSDLETRLLEAGDQGIPWDQALAWLGQAAAALDYAWDEFRLVHRDLKPGNLFITAQDKVKLLDFGLAWQLRRTLSRVSNRIDSSGTPAYMPPEAFVAGPADPRQDVYALGCISYELLTGQPPFDPAAARARPKDLYPPKPERIAEPVWQAIRRALAYERDQRPGSAGDYLQALKVAAGPLGGASRHEPAPQTAARPAAKDKILKILNSFREPAPPPAAGRRSPLPGEPWTEPYTGMEFLWVPAGEFLMGSEDGETNEKPVHRVRLQGFWLGKYPVTQAQWEKVMGNNPSDFKGADRPVETVSWNNAQAFIAQLKQRSSTAAGIRLPSEAEWEYAARSGSKDEQYAGGNDPDQVAWYSKNSGGATHPVGQKHPNGLGLHDLSGNVWEWVQDHWHGDYQGAPADGTAWELKDSSGRRAHRGGSWGNLPAGVRAASRIWDSPDDRFNYLGFRLAQD